MATSYMAAKSCFDKRLAKYSKACYHYHTPTESDSQDETTSLTTIFKPKQQKVKKKEKKEKKSEKYELPSTQTEGQIET